MVMAKLNKNKSIKKRNSQSRGAVKNFMDNSSVGMKIVVILFLVMCVLAIALAVMVNIQGQEEVPGVPITNFQEISDAPKEYQTNAEQSLWTLIERNANVEDLSMYSAAIRDGSYSQTTDGNKEIEHFIVDIEELRYSFEITLSWTKGQKKYTDLYVKVQCPYYTDVIYPDTVCVAEKPTAQIKRYLPHNDYINDGKLVHVEESVVGKEFRLLVKVDACKNQDVIDAAMEYTTKWIESIYMNPGDFVVESYDTCMVKTL